MSENEEGRHLYKIISDYQQQHDEYEQQRKKAEEGLQRTEEGLQRAEELVLVCSDVICELEKKYNFDNLEKISNIELIITKVYTFMEVFDRYIKENPSFGNKEIREETLGTWGEIKELYKIIRDG